MHMIRLPIALHERTAPLLQEGSKGAVEMRTHGWR